MKKMLLLKLLFLSYILLFVVSCGTDVTPADVLDVKNAEEIIISEDIIDNSIIEDTFIVDPEESTAFETVVEIDYSLSADEKELLESRFSASERAELSRPLVKNVAIGDVVVVGLVIRDILGQATHDFIVSVDLVDMRDYSNSKHDTDDALIEAWFDRTDLGPYTMERNDEIIIPLIIEVGDMMTADVAVLPGNYIFYIAVKYLTGGGMTDTYETLELTLQVAE